MKRPFPAILLLILVSLIPMIPGCPDVSAQGPERAANYAPLLPGYSSIKVFDAQSRFVGRILPERKYWATIDQIPVFLQQALVAIEDARFYDHRGIDLRGITSALVRDVMKGRMAEGGSTITQQLIKNRYLSSKKTIERKVKEGLLAMEYERKYSKKQILEMYFNEVYFGNGAWGIVQAARLYFDKYPQELTEAECALLAGVPKAPTRYNPLANPTRVRDRKNLVLKRMAELSMITPEKEKRLRAMVVNVTPSGEAPYYLAHVRQKLLERYGPDIVEAGGLDVFAALDLSLQRQAEQILREGVERVSPLLQGALLAIDPLTGDILAAVGGKDYARSPYQRAFHAKRQPGSTIKPLIYAAALEKGYTASSLWDDEPVTYPRNEVETWTPRNYGKERYGTLTLRQALAHSNNVVAVKVLDTVGVANFVQYAANLGLPLRFPNDLSLALGTDEVTLAELVLAYTPLASGGFRPEPRTLLRIYERRLNNWVEFPPASIPVLSPAVAYVTTSMLRDVLAYGTARSLLSFSRQRPAAGKTGTTDEYRDAWFIGYTPQLIVGVWAGCDKPTPMGRGFVGGAVCAPIWGRFMRAALADKPVLDFPVPESVITAEIDPSTGQLACPACPQTFKEVYIAGTEPTELCPIHCRVTSLPPAATDPDPSPEPASHTTPLETHQTGTMHSGKPDPSRPEPTDGKRNPVSSP
jgi:1A family penicillin-binding protein